MLFEALIFAAVFLLVLALAGAAILAVIPRMRVNVANVSLFVFGIILGWIAIPGLLLRLEHFSRIASPLPTWGRVANLVALIAGSIACGVGIVAVEDSVFSKRAQNPDRPA